MKRALLPFALLLAASPAAAPPGFAPTASYEKLDLDGWTVHVAETLRERDPGLAADTLTLLRAKLLDLTRALPPAAVKLLRPTPIWVERDDPRFPGMCYHPSAGWLRANGYNPDKAGSVQIGNARNFLAWTRDQPAMVLHEFAHAYHHQHLTAADRASLQAAFDNARSKDLYTRVLRASGRTERAYALNNADEYFAESSEAFFGTNDFYPFVRAELEQHDPTMTATLRALWRLAP
jgi:hypothetical protein